jgi:protein tyrosine/serine phosphatase
LREAAHKEGLLTSIYRNLVDDQERKKEAELIKSRIQREIIARYEAKKKAYSQQLISIEQAKKKLFRI